MPTGGTTKAGPFSWYDVPDGRWRLVVRATVNDDDTAVVVREFDNHTRSFVPAGFSLPEAKSSVAWRDADTLWVATDFGPGSLTTSGYARVVKQWKRGTPLAEAQTVFEARPEHVWAAVHVDGGLLAVRGELARHGHDVIVAEAGGGRPTFDRLLHGLLVQDLQA